MLVTLPESGWITDKREEKRWKAKLHWRSLFRTSNRECFSQQSAGLQGDGAVISWQRGAGHVGTTRLTSKTADLKNTDCTHTLSVCVCDISLFLSLVRPLSKFVSFCSYIYVAVFLHSFSKIRNILKLKSVRKWNRLWKWEKFWKGTLFFFSRRGEKITFWFFFQFTNTSLPFHLFRWCVSF